MNNPDTIVMQSLTPDFTKKYGIKVNYMTLPENTLRQKVTSDVATGGGQFDIATVATNGLDGHAEIVRGAGYADATVGAGAGGQIAPALTAGTRVGSPPGQARGRDSSVRAVGPWSDLGIRARVAAVVIARTCPVGNGVTPDAAGTDAGARRATPASA